MFTPRRYILLALSILVCHFRCCYLGVSSPLATFQVVIHFVLSISHESYGKATSLSSLTSYIPLSRNGGSTYRRPITPGTRFNGNDTYVADGPRANAAFVVLARNSDLWEFM